MTSRFVVFGASGDLTRSYLMPALVRLHAAGRLAGDLAIVGAARDPWDTEVFRRRIGEGLARRSGARSARIPWRRSSASSSRHASSGS